MPKTPCFSKPPAPEVWKKLLRNEDHWKPERSVWSVAHSWREACGVPQEVAGLLGEDIELTDMEPEYNVELGQEGGVGGPVQCDVFARVKVDGRACALVIEAKLDEPFGLELSKWRIENDDSPDSVANREARLTKICKVLELEFPPDDSLRYQLFSQTFAAVRMAECMGADMAAMIVQSFCDQDSGFDDFVAFCEQFEVQFMTDHAFEIDLNSGLRLLLGWAHCPIPRGKN